MYLLFTKLPVNQSDAYLNGYKRRYNEIMCGVGSRYLFYYKNNIVNRFN